MTVSPSRSWPSEPTNRLTVPAKRAYVAQALVHRVGELLLRGPQFEADLDPTEWSASVTAGRSLDEPRWLVIGQIDGRHRSAVVTYRGGRTRIISVRRSREEEVAVYES